MKTKETRTYSFENEMKEDSLSNKTAEQTKGLIFVEFMNFVELNSIKGIVEFSYSIEFESKSNRILIIDNIITVQIEENGEKCDYINDFDTFLSNYISKNQITDLLSIHYSFRFVTENITLSYSNFGVN